METATEITSRSKETATFLKFCIQKLDSFGDEMKNSTKDTQEEFPPCFDSLSQYETWMEKAKETFAVEELAEASYCTDCTVKYKLKMMEAGRCSYPDTFFVMTEEGEIIGLNPSQPNYLSRPGQNYEIL